MSVGHQITREHAPIMFYVTTALTFKTVLKVASLRQNEQTEIVKYSESNSNKINCFIIMFCLIIVNEGSTSSALQRQTSLTWSLGNL